MILLDQIVQVLRGADLRVCRQQKIGFHFAHGPIRGDVPIQRDRPRQSMNQFGRHRKRRVPASRRRECRLHRRAASEVDERPLLLIVKKPDSALTGTNCSPSLTAGWRGGGSRTRWSSSSRSPSARPARCSSTGCGSSTRITTCRPDTPTQQQPVSYKQQLHKPPVPPGGPTTGGEEMKSTLKLKLSSAAALVMFATAAHAQSSVTLYGVSTPDCCIKAPRRHRSSRTHRTWGMSINSRTAASIRATGA